MKEEETDKTHYFEKIIGQKEERKMKARQDKRSEWYGLSFFGMVGWSIAMPTIMGVALGIWLDKNYAQDFSWTLSLLIAGMLVGCVFAWNWVQKEQKSMQQKKDEKHE